MTPPTPPRPPADRELLALVLHSGLDSGEVARVAGDAPAATYVRISRLKDGLGRAAAALLVARHHRRDCADLDALLAAWDGAYSPLWRKRIARHVESCAACDRSRKAAATSLFSIAGAAPLVVLPLALRARVVAVAGEAASAVSSTPAAAGAMPAGTAPAAPATAAGTPDGGAANAGVVAFGADGWPHTRTVVGTSHPPSPAGGSRGGRGRPARACRGVGRGRRHRRYCGRRRQCRPGRHRRWGRR